MQPSSFGKYLFAFVVASLSLAPCVTAAAAPRPQIALVVGNATYGGDWGKLPNPLNDARLMEQALTRVGYRVSLVLDSNQRTLKGAIASLGDQLRRAGPNAVGLFYYAGHGFQQHGENWLVPIGAVMTKPADADLEGVPVSSVLSQMEYAGNAVNIVILDACRNDRFHRGAGGLAQIKEAPRGSFVAFATAPGQPSFDGSTGNSPYTRALAEEIQRGGAPLEVIFRRVRERVLKDTNNQQTPWESSSVTGEYYFGSDAPTGSARPSPEPEITPDAQELAAWQSLGTAPSREELEAFLKEFPSGRFAGIAHAKLAALTKPPTPIKPPLGTQTAMTVPQAAGPSFDCNAENGYTERAICASPDLSALDRRMADIYQGLKSRLFGADRDALVQSQRNWLLIRGQCREPGVADCLRQLYEKRIGELESRSG